MVSGKALIVTALLLALVLPSTLVTADVEDELTELTEEASHIHVTGAATWTWFTPQYPNGLPDEGVLEVFLNCSRDFGCSGYVAFRGPMGNAFCSGTEYMPTTGGAIAVVLDLAESSSCRAFEASASPTPISGLCYFGAKVYGSSIQGQGGGVGVGYC